MSGAKAPDFDAYGWLSTKINAPSNSKYNIYEMPGSKGLSPHELAHRWVKDLRLRPDMSIKVG